MKREMFLMKEKRILTKMSNNQTGLTESHRRQLKGSAFRSRPMEERMIVYQEFRELYRANPLALEQIDIFDSNSPYHEHRETLITALRKGNEKIKKTEVIWFSENYPLTTSAPSYVE